MTEEEMMFNDVREKQPSALVEVDTGDHKDACKAGEDDGGTSQRRRDS